MSYLSRSIYQRLALRRATSAIFLAVVLGGAFPTGALAQAASVTIDSNKPTLEKQDNGWTAGLAFTNLTDKEIDLAVPQSDSGCEPELQPEKLQPAEHSEVKLTIPLSCNVTNHSIKLAIEAKGATPSAFRVVATEKPKATSHWYYFLVFPVALLVLMVLMCTIASERDDKGRKESLEHLEASWSFSDSWATNITAAGALAAAILGSTEVLTTLLGQDAKGPVALATVGAAVGAAIAGAAPLVLGATKTDENFDSVRGLLLASAVTLAGAFGELVILAVASQELNLTTGGHVLAWVAFLLAAILLYFYACRSIDVTIKQGTKKPSEPPSETMEAAEKIVAALKALSDGNTNETAKAIAPGLHLIASRAVGERRMPRRSTLL